MVDLDALVGTPPIPSLAALEVGVDIAVDADLVEVRRKSVALAERSSLTPVA